MTKTAVVYDKWLQSIGGGEVVACNLAKVLLDEGYRVLLISGKKVSKRSIQEKLNIDISGVEVMEIWNDESEIKKLTKNKDLFVNITYADYTYGYAKRNIYYAHFPTQPYKSLEDYFMIKIILPLASKFIKPVELMSETDVTMLEEGGLAYLLKDSNKIAISYLEIDKLYFVEFKLFITDFSKLVLEACQVSMDKAEIISQEVRIKHHDNQVVFVLKFKPKSSTIFVNLSFNKTQINNLDINNAKPLPHFLPYSQENLLYNNKFYLVYPRVKVWSVGEAIPKNIYQRICSRLRAGIFSNILERLKTYQVIVSHSDYVKRWIGSYWHMEAKVIYPPVEMLFEKYRIDHGQRKNWICSVGRFFTLGHGKKQEVMIKAFKQLYDLGYKNWQLHLAGGVGNEPSSLEFVNYLEKEAKGYPIFFHFNSSRKEIENLYLKSKIYWHAAGYGENESKNPVKFEHFGIAPVEAVSAGCIPILFNGGGLAEIIEIIKLSKQKHTFKKIDHLVENTISIINKNYHEPDWQQIFQILEEEFSLDAFKRKIIGLI